MLDDSTSDDGDGDDVNSESVTPNEGWSLLLEEMDEMALELETEGWETLTIPAGDVAAVISESSPVDEHGYVYVIPGNAADRFESLFISDGFPVTEVFQQTTANHLFLLTVFKDTATNTAILLSGVLEPSTLAQCRNRAEKTGTMYTHICRINGTHLGSFKHDDWAPFFPETE